MSLLSAMDSSPSNTSPNTDPVLRTVFRQGDVYADRWSENVRDLLHIVEPVESDIKTALEAGRSVVISGNAGDGKSHLALRVLKECDSGRVKPWEDPSDTPPNVNAGDLLFVPDASRFEFDELAKVVESVIEAQGQMLITVNEGPLARLAEHSTTGLWREIRETLHKRARGLEGVDPEGILIVNLGARDLTGTNFIDRAIELVAQNAERCPHCISDEDCPRTVGAELLLISPSAKAALKELFILASETGRRVTARDIWIGLIDLFFGHTCPLPASDQEKVSGFWWNRAFEPSSQLGSMIEGEFDPIMSPEGSSDAAIWSADFSAAGLPAGYPTAPVPNDTGDSELVSFKSAKRAWFFFAGVDAHGLIREQSRAREFASLVRSAVTAPGSATGKLVELVNLFRLNIQSQTELWVSRFHSMTVNKPPTMFASSVKRQSADITIKVPFSCDPLVVEHGGLWPTALLVGWTEDMRHFIRVDKAAWERLGKGRSLSQDRPQELLDEVLESFFSCLPIAQKPTDAVEITVYDHIQGSQSRLRVTNNGHERRLDVLK
jgi:hypothetical protein